MSAGELHHLRARVEEAEDKADAAITDLRWLNRRNERRHKEVAERLDKIEETQAAQGRAMNGWFRRYELQLQAVLDKASDARRQAAATDRRVSQIEQADIEWAAKMAVAQADGDAEAKAFRRKLVMKLVSGGGGVSIILAIIAAISQCNGG